MFPRLRAKETCCGNIFVSDKQKNVSDFFRKHFVSAKNVSVFACRGNSVDQILLLHKLYFLN